jgi:hypothetical protein
MATIASKIQWTTAAFAVAAAATLVPVAFADPTDPDTGDTGSAAVGSSAGQAPTRSTRKDRSRVNDDAVAAQTGDSDSTESSSNTGGPSNGSTGDSTGTGRASTDLSVPDSDVATPSTGPEVTSPTANATAPLAVGDEVTIIEVPLVADPDLQTATFGWMQNLDLDVCVLGLSQRISGQQSVIGPYGTSSLSFNSSGCG